MYFVLSGGGTAGHINPALALAEELQRRGHDVAFAGTPGGIEARLVPQAGFAFRPFEAAGFNRRHPQTIFHALKLISASTGKARAWFAERRPDAVACFGGYVCIPVGRAAQAMGIPTVVHEQNSVMGLANKELSRKAVRVALTYEAAGSVVADKGKIHLTGNPVRSSIFAASRDAGRAYAGVPDDAVMLTVFGGSAGARHINQAVCALKGRLLERQGLYIRHITGPKELESVCDALALTNAEAARWRLVGYEDRMGDVLAASDAVLSRAGATSLAEITALRIPALLVPYPFATADHQTMNAKSCVECGAALSVADADLDTPAFAEALLRLVDDAAARDGMRAAAEVFGTQQAAGKLADVVIGAATA